MNLNKIKDDIKLFTPCASGEIQIKSHELASQIIFKSDANTWVMKIIKDQGVFFNREAFPNTKPDEFAQAVIEILERSYSVKFERKNPPYDRHE